MCGGGTSRLGFIIVSTVVATAIGTCSAGSAVADTDRAAIQQSMADLIAAGAQSVQIRVHDSDGDWVSSAGTVAFGSPEVAPSDGRFRIGSVTKMFTSTVLLQLTGEQNITLDDPVDRYLPDLGIDHRITIRMLLGHTSGLVDYFSSAVNGDDPISWLSSPGPTQLIDWAVHQPLQFDPGSGYSYSNSNYLVAAMLIEKLSGSTYAEQITDRLIRPLGLDGTAVGVAAIIGPHAHAYQPMQYVPIPIDVTDLRSLSGWGDGDIVSTTADLDTFIAALLSGRLLSPERFAEMSQFREISPTGAYGLGLTRTADSTCTVLGHSGKVPGYLSDVLSTPDGSQRVEVAVTTGPAADPGTVTKLGAAVVGLASLAVCGHPVTY